MLEVTAWAILRSTDCRYFDVEHALQVVCAGCWEQNDDLLQASSITYLRPVPLLRQLPPTAAAWRLGLFPSLPLSATPVPAAPGLSPTE